MSRAFITTDEGVRVPFLRGILTRSLQEAGLSFDEAYQISTVIRDEIKNTGDMTSQDLRNRVLGVLKEFNSSVLESYQDHSLKTPVILVEDENGNTIPFSRGELRMRLEACELDPEESAILASHVHDTLLKKGHEIISLSYTKNLIYKMIKSEKGEQQAKNYLIWEEFFESGQPIIILLGGVAGSGKSTISSELSHRLQIARSQSTDLLREVLRTIIPESLVPTLHDSSFLAWKKLPKLAEVDRDQEELLISGFVAQAELLSLSLEATIRRALKEQISLILEGVHILPNFTEKISFESDPIIVPLMLGVLSPKKLRRRIWNRQQQTPHRRAQRYLDNFDAIWKQQSFLLSEADRQNVPIIPNIEKERTIRRALGTILAALSKRFEGKKLDD